MFLQPGRTFQQPGPICHLPPFLVVADPVIPGVARVQPLGHHCPAREPPGHPFQVLIDPHCLALAPRGQHAPAVESIPVWIDHSGQSDPQLGPLFLITDPTCRTSGRIFPINVRTSRQNGPIFPIRTGPICQINARTFPIKGLTSPISDPTFLIADRCGRQQIGL